MMEKDRRLRLENQQRLRDLVRDHGDEVRVFSAHDWIELETLKAEAVISASPVRSGGDGDARRRIEERRDERAR
jgi:hypothetical protein